MLKWLDRWMAQFAPKDDSEAYAERTAETAPAHEAVFTLLEDPARATPERARVLTAAIRAIAPEKCAEPAFARRLMRDFLSGFASHDAPVGVTIAPAQSALDLMPALRTTLAGDAAPFALVEGVLAMRTGQFDLAFERIARTNAERDVGLTEDWSRFLPSSCREDVLPKAVDLAARTLAGLRNPDLRYWAKSFLAVPVGRPEVRNGDELLLAAGEIVLELHRAAGEVIRPEPAERRALLASVDAHYRAIFREFHPQAADARRMLSLLEGAD